MRVIIAEKPSLARNIASAISEKQSKRQGYIEVGEYLVTWAFGHLFSLADIEYYSPSENPHWNMGNLPCLPREFHYELKKGPDKRVDEGVLRQFETIRALCRRDDVDAVINAGDADREGEVIVRLCIRKSFDEAIPENKKIMRLWLPDQTPETVRAALADMKEDGEYDGLANEGYARTFIDWLYGVNLTRYATLRTGTLLRVGRVIIPIVKAIYDRDMEIRNFVPGKYFAVVSRAETAGETVELTSKQKFDEHDRAKAEQYCSELNRRGAVVTSVKKKKETLNPGKLYSLSKLQNVLGKKYKMSMAQSLEIVQKLYEEGFLTYPRTNSEYLATAEKDKMKKIIGSLSKIGYPVTFKDKKTIFDDSKIESHSAITPTYKIPDKNRLSENERIVYSTVVRRFVAVFCSEECIANKTEITIAVSDTDTLETFTLKGSVIVEKGWTKYDDFTQKDKILPNLSKGDAVNIDFRPTEKETSPPKHYTIETLNNYLKNPFREEKAQKNEDGSDDEDYRAIFEGLELGTEATRTGIIDNARKSEYILLKKDVYTILPGGEFLIESLQKMNISMDKYKTSEIGKALKRVFRGSMTVRESVELAEKEISVYFEKRDTAIEQDTDTGFYGDIVGKCPICGRDLRRGKFSYGCTGYKEGCKFSVSCYICSRAISVSNLKLLLETGKTSKIQGFVSKKTGKPFDASLVLREGRAEFDFSNPQ